MNTLDVIPEPLQREYFGFDVKIGSHPRYGKNASWENYKHPDSKPGGELGPKTYWYAYEMESGEIGIKYATERNVFGPAVHCVIPKIGTFEETIFQYWKK